VAEPAASLPWPVVRPWLERRRFSAGVLVNAGRGSLPGWHRAHASTLRATEDGAQRARSQPQAFTESQNHRIVGVGRDLCGSSSPTPLPKQGHPEQGAQDLVQAGLEYLQRRRLHNLPGQPGPGLRHLQREEVLPHVRLPSAGRRQVPEGLTLCRGGN